MDTPQSWFNLQGFLQDIENAKQNSESERDLRDMVASMIQRCPVPVLVDVAMAIYEARKAELKKPTNN